MVQKILAGMFLSLCLASLAFSQSSDNGGALGGTDLYVRGSNSGTPIPSNLAAGGSESSIRDLV